MFPILSDPILRAIPWSVLEPHEAQAQKNHSQTLKRLASRGGLSPCEAIAIILDRPWSKVPQEWARAKILLILWDKYKAARDPAV
jgi:hypothetical protein